MSVRTIVLATMLGSCGLAVAAEEDVPDMEFFEYLGMWEETDEEWLMFDELVTAENKREPEPREPDDEEPVEKDDES
jgi:hypothetical protein